MELTIDDIRTMIGSYVLELLGKDKEIKELKAQIDSLSRDNASPSKLHAVEHPDILMSKEK